MKSIGITGVFKKNDRIFTENPACCKGIRVYNEKLISSKGREFRSWNPYKSKLAAAILQGLKKLDIKPDSHVLYLGAATGTTVSHFSDIAQNGMIYAVENSAIALKGLLQLSRKRMNVIPILSDANHPDRYSHLVPIVDFVYQDISQRNQAEIFINNTNRYLKKGRTGVLMVKARSIDVSLKPKQAYKLVTDDLEKNGFEILDVIDLSPYEKDHSMILATF